jgi:squalene-hopene/tetraprenyl-beta-curcumene cyclase
LSGGVPDADDTSGALVALARLGEPDGRTVAAASRAVRWLLGVQNSDGGIPTFCRGWGALPFDRSTPEITAHALQGWSAWHRLVAPDLRQNIRTATRRAVKFLVTSQRRDGSWIPLWFGNQHAPAEDNPVYGTARVLAALDSELARETGAAASRSRGTAYLLDAQNADGGWGGAHGVSSSIEETGVVLTALALLAKDTADHQLATAVTRGANWLMDAIERGGAAAPVGLYFARLWYYEDLYPLVFGLTGLAAVLRDVVVMSYEF